MPDDGAKTVALEKMKVWFDPGRGVTMAEFHPGAELDIDDARESTRAMLEVADGREVPLLVDFTHLRSQTKECRDYYAKDPDHIKTYSAVALVVTSPLSRVLANFFMGINKPSKPTRVFDDRAKALSWLEGQR